MNVSVRMFFPWISRGTLITEIFKPPEGFGDLFLFE
jgi:hypothetical protein